MSPENTVYLKGTIRENDGYVTAKGHGSANTGSNSSILGTMTESLDHTLELAYQAHKRGR